MPDLTPKITKFVGDVVAAMGLSLRLSIEETPDAVRVNLEGDGGEVLLRRKGEALDALQQIVNAAFRRQLDGRQVVVDCMQFRRDKDEELRQMARFLADRAKSTGVAQEIGPLNPYARRIVHIAVAEDPAVASESIGDAFLKTVIITARRP
jgi:spoIIIJ-associated protein